LRLRNALVETLRDKAQKEKGGGKATLLAAKRLKEAVDKAVKERGVKDAVVAMVNRLETAVKLEGNGDGVNAALITNAKKVMNEEMKM
jgi:hypothetical protein